MAKKSFSISNAVSYGWKTTTKRLGFFVVFVLIIILLSAIPSSISATLDSNHNEGMGFIVKIISWVIQLTVSLGIINLVLRIYDKKKTSYSDLFSKFNIIIPYFIASFIYGAIVIVGLILLVVPGIIWAIKFQYFAYFMVDKNLGPIDALKASSKLTEGVRWNLFFLKLVIILINIVGFICLIVGLFITIPLGMLAEGYVFRKLQGK